MSDYNTKHGDETLNKLSAEQKAEKKEKTGIDCDYEGKRWERDEKRNLLVQHWVNGNIRQGSNGPFLSTKLGKPYLKEGKYEVTAPIVEPQAPAPAPAKPAKTDDFDDDIPF